MTHTQNCILIVDDEFLIAEGLRLQVESMGLPVCGTVPTAEEAIAQAEIHRPSIVLMDVRLAGPKDGIDAAIAIHESVGSKIIFITGSSDATTMERLQRHGGLSTVLFKPISERRLHNAIDTMLAGGDMP